MTQKPKFQLDSIHSGPQQSPGFLLWQLSTSWRSSIEETLRVFELTHPQFVLLALVGWYSKKKTVVNQVLIGKMARLDPNTTSQVLRGLEKKGLIKRSAASDGRAKHVTLTPMGAEKISLALPAVEQADSRFFSALSQAESIQLVGLFHKILPEG